MRLSCEDGPNSGANLCPVTVYACLAFPALELTARIHSVHALDTLKGAPNTDACASIITHAAPAHVRLHLSRLDAAICTRAFAAHANTDMQKRHKSYRTWRRTKSSIVRAVAVCDDLVPLHTPNTHACFERSCAVPDIDQQARTGSPRPVGSRQGARPVGPSTRRRHTHLRCSELFGAPAAPAARPECPRACRRHTTCLVHRPARDARARRALASTLIHKQDEATPGGYVRETGGLPRPGRDAAHARGGTGEEFFATAREGAARGTASRHGHLTMSVRGVSGSTPPHAAACALPIPVAPGTPCVDLCGQEGLSSARRSRVFLNKKKKASTNIS
jgi:hypothetical protein